MIETLGRTLVLAPHADDETLGCGGTLLRMREESPHEALWVLMTRMSEAAGYAPQEMREREAEIARVGHAYGFAETVQLPFDAASLDAVPLAKLIGALAAVFDRLRPQTVLLPHPSDAHSDHARTFAAGSACSKWFRRGELRRVMCYEVPSETGFNLDPNARPFAPTCHVRLTREHVERKIAVMTGYRTEMAPFPFPRSPESIRALAAVRGSQCGSEAAEAFLVLRETV